MVCLSKKASTEADETTPPDLLMQFGNANFVPPRALWGAGGRMIYMYVS